eukprot:4876366-Prymnesium_polylepis.1
MPRGRKGGNPSRFVQYSTRYSTSSTEVRRWVGATAYGVLMVETPQTKAQLDAVDRSPLAIDDRHATQDRAGRGVTLGDSRNSKAFEL